MDCVDPVGWMYQTSIFICGLSIALGLAIQFTTGHAPKLFL
jgi:hypothetical protein